MEKSGRDLSEREREERWIFLSFCYGAVVLHPVKRNMMGNVCRIVMLLTVAEASSLQNIILLSFYTPQRETTEALQRVMYTLTIHSSKSCAKHKALWRHEPLGFSMNQPHHHPTSTTLRQPSSQGNRRSGRTHNIWYSNQKLILIPKTVLASKIIYMQYAIFIDHHHHCR